MQTQPVQRPPQPEKKGLNLGKGTLVIGLILFVAAMFILPQLLDSGDDSNASIRQADDLPAGVPPENVLGADIGPIYSAASVDRNGCAVDHTTTFERSDTIFVVAEDSDVPAGATLFVRLYQGDTPVEDTQEITADQDYSDTCVNFLFEPVEGAAFEPGDYEAELFVNGNPAGSVSFAIR